MGPHVGTRMKRLVFGLVFAFGSVGGGAVLGEAHAQDPAPAPADPAAPADPSTTPPASEPGGSEGAVTTQTPQGQPGAAARRTWDDVVVVPRNAFLKSGRLELFPFSGVSLNDNLIRHYSFGGNLNYYLSDVFSVGLEGQYYIKERTDRESVVGL